MRAREGRTDSDNSTGDVECATFYVGEQLVGTDIHRVQEINRLLELTEVPHSPTCVRGVTNLRGDVVTVIDLRTVLGLGPADITDRSRYVIVTSCGERIGLLVDDIADVVKARVDRVEAPPANIGGIDSRYFKGVCALDSELLVILDIDEVLSVDSFEQPTEAQGVLRVADQAGVASRL